MLSEQKEQHGVGCSDAEKRSLALTASGAVSAISTLHHVPSVELTAFSVALAEGPSSLLQVLLSAAQGDHPE